MAYLKNLKIYTNRPLGTHRPISRPQIVSTRIPWYTQLYRTYWQTPRTSGTTYVSKLFSTRWFANWWQQPMQPIVLAQPITPKLPLAVEPTLVEKIAQAAMTEIQTAHTKAQIPVIEKSLMICTPPGIASALLPEFKSRDAIYAYLEGRNHELDMKYKEIEGMDDVAWQTYLDKRKQERDYLTNVYYKQPCDKVVHDEDLSPFVLEQTKRLLKLVGINPASVSISVMRKGKRGGAIGSARGPDIAIEDSGMEVQRPAELQFNPDWFKDAKHKHILKVIAHEIGHLLRHHAYSMAKYPMVVQGRNLARLSKKEIAKIEAKDAALADLHLKRGLLQELEADIFVALHNKEIANIMHEYLLEILASTEYITNKPRSEIHQSINDWYHWITKVNQAHGG